MKFESSDKRVHNEVLTVYINPVQKTIFSFRGRNKNTAYKIKNSS